MFKPIKFNMGYIANIKTGERDDIVVSTLAPNNLKDILIGGCVTLAGICWLTITAFKKGAKEFDNAEFETLKKLGLIKNMDDHGGYDVKHNISES